MKAFITLIAVIAFVSTGVAQDFTKAMSTAKTAYGAGKLEDTHFALQQAMQEVDLVIGKEVLKLLPPKMDAMEIIAREDNVASNVGYVGATIHRSYEKSGRKADISIISNSPLVAMTNTVLNTPLLGGMMSDGKSKTVKVQGYKARLEKQAGSTNDKNDYELQIPLGSALITFKVDDCTDTQILEFAETIPLQKIAKLIQ
ncbi:hypothetical protein [Mucilaginibacter sp.]|jgi:hypothetical protein|uniref:hypothetical protein n=1 Tax=Mucilaginibacter sp. TaxID=1882438 RepID=UPI0025EC08F3|nr:hypothetical protein [Mucilaginibacter sp.]